MSTRTIGVITLAALILTGCTGGQDGAGEQAVGPPQSAGSTPADPQSLTSPLPLLDGPIASTTAAGTPAADYADRIVATGLDPGVALFLVNTESTVEVVDGHTFVVRSDFPNGATGEATYHLFAPTMMSPSDPPTFTSEVVDDQFHYVMTYAVDTTSMPTQMKAQIANGLPAESAVRPAIAGNAATIEPLGLAPLSGHVTTVVDGLDDTVGVLVEGVVSQSQESVVDTLAQGAEDLGLGKGPATSWDAFKAGKKVWEALDANAIVAAALAEIDALEECAKNPTNAVTKQQYAKDSAAQQKAVDTVAAARAQIKVSTAVLFSSLVADTGSGLVAEAPWLGFLVSPAVNYTKDSLMTAIKSEVDRAKAAVVPCRPNAYKISGKLPSAPAGIVVTGTVCRLDREFVAMLDGDYVGRMHFVPDDATAGSAKFSGKLGIAPLKAVGHGDYTVTLSDDGSTGAIDLPFTSTVKIPAPGKDQTLTYPVHLTLTQVPPCEEVD